MKRVLYVISVVLAFFPYLSSQVAEGILPFNSYGGGPFDSVNLGNLNIHFSVPVLNKAGRGLPFNYALTYEGSVYAPVVSSGTTSWKPVTNVNNVASYWGWQGLGPVFSPYVSYAVTYSSGMCGQYGNQPWSGYTFGYFAYHETTGVSHPFNAGGSYYNSPGGPNCPPSGSQPSGVETQTATDGSGYVINVSFGNGSASGSIQSRDGTLVNAPWLTTPPQASSPYTATDRNGNEITFNNGTYTDTLNQAVLTMNGAAPNPVTLSYIPPAGEASSSRVSVTVNFVNYTVQTNFGANDASGHAILEYRSSTAVALVDNITLPDGTKYTFRYEPTPSTPASGACTAINGTAGCVTGRLTKVTLPTGGNIAYAYSGGANGIINDGSAAGLTRTVSSPGGQWTYSRNQVSGNHWQTTVSSPAGDNTVLDFMEDSASSGETYSFYETQRQTPLLTTVTCWNGNSSNCTTTAVSSPITEKLATLQYPGGQQSMIDTTYNGGGTGSGLVSQINQYGYSTGTPTTLLRQTTYFYGSWTGSNCLPLGNNIMDAPCEIKVTDGSSPANTLSDTKYTYDEYSSYPLQPTTGTPQHGSISGSRGNGTTIKTTVIGSTTLTQHFSYYDTGNVYQTTDVNNAVTTYTYGTGAQGNSTISCGNSFPTQVSLPISGLSSSYVWDCVGGVNTKTTDANANSTTTTYADAYFWRPASTQDPAGASTSFTYTPYSSGTGALASVENKMLFNNNASVVDQLKTIGTFGQAVYSQQREGPSSSNWDSAQVLYDSLLRPYQASMPCVYSSTAFTDQNQACPSAATTTSTYDASGRVTQTQDGGGGWRKFTYSQNDVLQEVGPAPPNGESTKKKQLEYDALGRLTSVCELTTLSGYTTCTQAGGNNNGYFTTYSYTVDSSGYLNTTVTQGPQTRVYKYDLLGRLASEQNPETGTVVYTYDLSDATCGSYTSTGDLVEKKDALGNITCMKYDALHRITQATYPSGTYAVRTPSKCFVYDSAAVSGTNMTNAKGRLAEAYTTSSSSCPGTPIVDEGFSYSARGETTDVWEKTPNSGSYYHPAVTYWPDGVLNTLWISSLPAITYNVDGEGRPSTVSASSGQNPVTLTNYNTAGQVTKVTFGSGDGDEFFYDANTGRMSQYKFWANGSNEYGNLGWNANGTLGSLNITDPFNSGDKQNCTYSHDDLARISSTSCGSVWGQNFSYDAYGNISKSGSISWACSTCYNTHNQFNSGTYDANGNLLNDPFHTYTWDADSNPATIDSIGLTYDAFDRVVEQNQSGTYYQVVYTPLGTKMGKFKSGVIQQLYVPLPGGAQAEYYSWGLSNYRHADWLASDRMQSDATSRAVTDNNAYAPFGEPYAQTGNGEISFTGQNKDTDWLQYDFIARQYDPKQGRWISPDPAGLASVDPTSPQSWNRYAYVVNNPLSFIDPLGLDHVDFLGGCIYVWLSQMTTYTSPGGDPTFHMDEYLADVWCGLGNSTTSNCPVGVSCGPTGGGSGGGGGGSAANNPTCPAVPQAPPGVNISSNIKTMQWGKAITYLDPVWSLYAFSKIVGNKMPMDYKQYGWTLTDIGTRGPSPYEDFGNFNFGAVGAAWGFSLNVLERGAGYAQGKSGNSNPVWGKWYQGPPYGDDPNDQNQIALGYQYYKNGCYKTN